MLANHSFFSTFPLLVTLERSVLLVVELLFNVILYYTHQLSEIIQPVRMCEYIYVIISCFLS